MANKKGSRQLKWEDRISLGSVRLENEKCTIKVEEIEQYAEMNKSCYFV